MENTESPLVISSSDGETSETTENKSTNDFLPLLLIFGFIIFVFGLITVGSFLLYKYGGNFFNSIDTEVSEYVEEESYVEETPMDEDELTAEEVTVDETVNIYINDVEYVVEDESAKPPSSPSSSGSTYSQPESCYKIDHELVPKDQCFDYETYYQLFSETSSYNSAKFRRNAADSTAEFTCDSDSDLFKESCEDAKDRKKDAEKEMDEHKDNIIKLIN